MNQLGLLAASIASALALAAAPVMRTAAPAVPVAQDAAATAPSAINLDPIHSMAVFRIQHLGAGFFWGRFNELAGSATWPLDDSAAPTFAQRGLSYGMPCLQCDGNDIFAVHASVSKVTARGHGPWDLGACVEAIRSVGFSNTLAIDPIGTGDPIKSVGRAAAQLRGVLEAEG